MIPPPPVEIRYLTDILGIEATLDLMRHYGGSRVYVPANPSEDSPLVKALGLDVARRLADIAGKTTIKVPLAKAWRSRVLRAQGHSEAQVARMLGIDESTVARHVRPKEDRFNQLKLGV